MSELNSTEKKDLAFIICPLGEPISNTRRNSDGLNSAVLKPILSEFFKTVQAPLDLVRPGAITSQVIILLNTADLVVANLTELNPNVMYELAVRHAAKKPVILMAEEGTKLPFDLMVERTIFYTNDMAGVESLKPELKRAIIQAMQDAEQDNPIYRALSQKLLTEMTTGDDTNSMMLKKIVELETILSNFINSNNLMNSPILKERSIDDIVLSNQIKLHWAEYNRERVLTLSLSKDDEISVDDRNLLVNVLNDGPWKFIGEVETSKRGKNEIIAQVNIKSIDLPTLENLLDQIGFEVNVKYPGLYTN